jgi:hypothetical protein
MVSTTFALCKLASARALTAASVAM